MIRQFLQRLLSCRYSMKSWKNAVSVLPLGSERWPLIIRWVSLVVGCFGMGIAATTVTFSFWQNAMRAILNQTETQSNIVFTFGSVGSYIAFPAGMLYERYGCQIDAAIGCLLTGLALFLLWLGTSTWTTLFAANPWIVDMVYFMVGFGCIFTYMASMMPNVDNFPFHQRGKVIGLLDAALSAGPTLMSILFNTAFTSGYTDSGQKSHQNLSGYFLTNFFLYLIISIALFFLTGPVKQSQVTSKSCDDAHVSSFYDTEQAPLLEKDSVALKYESEAESVAVLSNRRVETKKITPLEENPPNRFAEFPFRQLSVTKVIRRWNFHFLVMQFVLGSCTQTTFQANITTYLKSFNLTEYNLLFTVLNTTLQAITKFIAGIVSDMIAERGYMPRAVLFLIPYGLQTLFLFLSIFYGDNFLVLLFTCVFVGIAFGITWCQTPTMIGELFGGNYLGSNWGWAMLLTAVGGFPFSLGFSAIYESAITDPEEIYCYGLHCFTWSFALLTATSLCSLIFAIGLTKNMFRNATDRQHFGLQKVY